MRGQFLSSAPCSGVTTALSLGAVLLSLLRCRRKVASGRAETLSRSACEVGFSVSSAAWAATGCNCLDHPPFRGTSCQLAESHLSEMPT
jgi:uncharacterized protein (TIGR03382 family)